MKVAIYSRFSTDSQDRTSIAGQEANCEALAAREDFEIVAWFRDEGISGNDDSRPDYQELLAALQRGDFDGVICDETSRITRNQAELHRLVAELRFRDQFLVTCDGIDTRTETSEIVLSVKAAIDQMEGRKIGYRTYRSLRERHKAGFSAGGRIYGYTTEQDGDYRRRVIVPEQAKVIQEIFERFAKGESAKAIARGLNEQGVKSPGSYWNNRTRRSVGWTHTTLLGSKAKASGILRNAIYKGEVTWNKRAGKKKPGTGRRVQKRRPESEWVRVQDQTPRIVSDEIWQKVQDRLRRARINTNGAKRRGRPPRYLLSGLLKCASCGSSYTVCNGRSYRCSSQSNGRDVLCDQGRYLFRDMVERELLSGIKAQLLDPRTVKAMAREIRRQAQAPGPDYESEVRQIDQQIAHIVDSLASMGRSEALTAKLTELEGRRAELTRMAVSTPTLLVADAEGRWEALVSDLENLREYAEPDELEQARGLLQEIIGEVEVREESGGVFAYAWLNALSGYKGGAEERT